jgi:hypothetical protein
MPVSMKWFASLKRINTLVRRLIIQYMIMDEMLETECNSNMNSMTRTPYLAVDLIISHHKSSI